MWFFCIGSRHRSATKNIYGGLTSKGSKVLFGYSSICNRKKSKTVSADTIQDEDLSDFFKNLGVKGLNVSKRMANFFGNF